MDQPRVLLSAQEIAARIDALAADIARTLPPEFVVVGLLKSAAVFVADLVRALDRTGARPEIEFMRLSSYGLAKESSGAVELLGDIPAHLAGRRVLMQPDDLQRTLTALLGWANSRGLVLGALDARPTSLEEAFLAVAASGGEPVNGNDEAEDVAA